MLQALHWNLKPAEGGGSLDNNGESKDLHKSTSAYQNQHGWKHVKWCEVTHQCVRRPCTKSLEEEFGHVWKSMAQTSDIQYHQIFFCQPETIEEKPASPLVIKDSQTMLKPVEFYPACSARNWSAGTLLAGIEVVSAFHFACSIKRSSS